MQTNGFNYAAIVISSAGGLGLFLYGMHVMSEGLQKAAGNRMRKLLEILTKNKLMGVLVGAFVTGIIQSSSATTVMVVGFVNAGLMNLSQTVGVIMGANIGTTVTSWIVSSIEWAEFLKPSVMAPVAIAIGAAMVIFAKRYSVKQIGEVIVGFGILFMGITLMTEGLSPLGDSPVFSNMFATMGRNPLLGILVGTLVTAIIQSSSASIGILQSLALSGGFISWGAAVYIIMGQNIGTCVTAIISSIGTSKNARAAAYIHLLFNIIGSIVFSVIAFLLFKYVLVNLSVQQISVTEISIVHTLFNVLNTILLYPFSDLLVKLAQRMTSAGMIHEDDSKTIHLDDRLLETHSFALKNCINETVRLGNMARENFKLSIEALLEKNTSKIETVLIEENNIDELEAGISRFLVKLSNLNKNMEENDTIMSLFHTINDMERIGDHSENLAEFAQMMIERGLAFSEEATSELKEMSSIALQAVSNAVAALESDDRVMAQKVKSVEEVVDKLEKELREHHIHRLTRDECDSMTGVVFLNTISNLERVSDHANNIAESILSKAIKKTIKVQK